jgi:diaminopimelate decarboxylase
VTSERIEVGAAVAGIDAEQLVADFGSPLYVYDADAIRARVARFRAAMPETVELAFATKANSSPAVLELLAGEGLSADVASGGELAAVLRAGFDGGCVVFTGPGKTDAELEAGLRAGVGALTVESLDELEALIAMAPTATPGQGLMLRLATEGGDEDTPIISGLAGAKFGLTDEEADEAVRRLGSAGVLAPAGPFVLRGFHAFGATNVLDASVLLKGLADLATRAERVAARHGLALDLIDAGGGLGIPYDDGVSELDLDALAQGVRAELATWASRPGLADARLVLEPGRWLTGPTGAYLCQVVRTKQRQGHAIAVTDGGIHHLLRPRLVDHDQRVRAVGPSADRPADALVDVVGPLCTGLDILASVVTAPAPRSGDLYAVLDAGAYGYSESMPFFLSHPIPAEVLVDGGSVSVSRERIEPA